MSATHAPSRARTTFVLPEGLSATGPPEARGLARDEVRLLVARPGGVRHTQFVDLADQLSPGDLVVVNDSATVPAALDVVRPDGRRAVLHVSGPLDDGAPVGELRTPAGAQRVHDARAGEVLGTAGGTVTLSRAWPDPTATEGSRLWRLSPGDLDAVLWQHGQPIRYGYLDHDRPLADYQSVFATVPGSAEMASAGRPFSHRLVTALVGRGVQVAPITLHTGVSSLEADETPLPERLHVPDATARLVESTRAAGGRVVAVGTTVTRALETAADAGGTVLPYRGWTDLVLGPETPARVVDGLVTGWHEPQASHLMLLEAVAGPELVQRAYDAALAERYLWHEFGDSALFLP
ncbi:S-adenosylmethionine:tRNA ribosyltransferase-isomerase [Solicola sp. PLA-1-18]|uniref:S-adenosylmethionine:tRNA ribosyltransferase-isomerase n=1 Tax=Solicola sp. PLA-1-18 TaxID=3380532 RepID=UPI003B802B0E